MAGQLPRSSFFDGCGKCPHLSATALFVGTRMECRAIEVGVRDEKWAWIQNFFATLSKLRG